MTKPLAIHPAQPLPAGRYHLDRYGRLHAALTTGVVAIAVVTVRAKPQVAPPAPVHSSVRLDPSPPRRALEPTRSLARKPKPRAVSVPAEELAPASETDAAMAEFEANLLAIRARRAKQSPAKVEPKVDGAKIAAAHRAKALGPAAKKAPTRRALSDGECHRCGVRTTIGCDHFLPYLGDG